MSLQLLLSRKSSSSDRRSFLRNLSLASAFAAVPGAFAEALTQTPKQTEGPFYPDQLPLDTDNDLLVINSGITPAVGTVSWLNGRILDSKGEPLRGALVEIWQCDANGAYIHSKSGNAAKRDGNFQGYGRFTTGKDGAYLFRTIKPVAYPGRTPHIHMKVRLGGKELLTTQCYVKGDPGNEKDGVLRGIRDPKVLESVMVDFAALPGSKAGELAGKFDVVLGFTPEA